MLLEEFDVRWEEKLKVMSARKCRECKQWIFSTTIGSLDTPEWHCRHGFTPYEHCQYEAAYNDQLRQDYYRQHPDELQLTFNF